MSVTQAQANSLALDWINAWNKHDLDTVLEHYSDDIIFASPFVVTLTGKEDGTLHGKEELRAYWEKALAKYTDLRFELYSALPGVSSVVIYYKSVKNLHAAETMVLNNKGKVVRVYCHYSCMKLSEGESPPLSLLKDCHPFEHVDQSECW